MDTSKEYIKMLTRAQLQNDWKPKDGDFVWHPNEGEEAFGCIEFPEEDGIVILSEVHTKEWWQSWLWLPRQDQLQKMVFDTLKKKFPNYDEYRKIIDYNFDNSNLLCSFNNFATTHFLRLHNSMEQLWLAFVMSERYSKRWSGKEWVKK